MRMLTFVRLSTRLVARGTWHEFRFPANGLHHRAGPYGLAIAAHLQFVGIDFRIFGSPMRRWLSQMPKSMLLKSEGCASSLPDPAGRHNLAQYCREEGLPYSEYGARVSRGVLARYAVSFQQKLVPHVEDVLVIAVSKLRDGFELSLSSGEKLHSANVIVATGMDYMAHSPEELGRLPRPNCGRTPLTTMT